MDIEYGYKVKTQKISTDYAVLLLVPKRPVTTFRNQLRQFFQPNTICLIEPILLSTININNPNHSPLSPLFNDNRHNNLTLALTVAGNVAWKRIHIGDKLCLRCGSSCPAHPTAEGDSLAGYFALEGGQDQGGRGWRGKWVEGVETCG